MCECSTIWRSCNIAKHPHKITPEICARAALNDACKTPRNRQANLTWSLHTSARERSYLTTGVSCNHPLEVTAVIGSSAFACGESEISSSSLEEATSVRRLPDLINVWHCQTINVLHRKTTLTRTLRICARVYSLPGQHKPRRLTSQGCSTDVCVCICTWPR